MAIYGISFPVRTFHEIILHPNISSVLTVTLYWVAISLLDNCCLLSTWPWWHFTGQIYVNARGYKAHVCDLLGTKGPTKRWVVTEHVCPHSGPFAAAKKRQVRLDIPNRWKDGRRVWPWKLSDDSTNNSYCCKLSWSDPLPSSIDN